jgi:myo-inositol-1(or 4)-monophosphatase
LDIARSAVTAAGNKLKPHFGNIETESKGAGDSISGVFTRLDREVEQFLAKELGKFSSDVGFAGEEFGVQSQAKTTWIVDPIDGTAHFIRGLPFCTILVALVEDGQVVVSATHNIVTDETYWAIRGKGAFCNETRISVSQRSLSQSIVPFETHLEKPENYQKRMQVAATSGMVNFIGSGYELAMVAAGKLDGRIALDPYLYDWDVAAGSLLVREAGGIVTNIGTAGYDYTNHDYIMANPIVHRELTSGPGALFPI